MSTQKPRRAGEYLLQWGADRCRLYRYMNDIALSVVALLALAAVILGTIEVVQNFDWRQLFLFIFGDLLAFWILFHVSRGELLPFWLRYQADANGITVYPPLKQPVSFSWPEFIALDTKEMVLGRSDSRPVIRLLLRRYLFDDNPMIWSLGEVPRRLRKREAVMIGYTEERYRQILTFWEAAHPQS